MISSYELRIGNYVLADKKLQRISVITANGVFTVDNKKGDEQKSSEQSPEQISPVPLTDDLLKQCGFVFHDYFHFWQHIGTGIRSEMDIDRDYNVIDFMRKPIMSALTSLHQLQNTFFMMKGRELEVQEKPAVAVSK